MFGHGTLQRSSSSSSEFLGSDSPVDVMSPSLNFPLCPLTELTVPESFDSVSVRDSLLHSGSSSSRSHNSPSCTSLASCSCTQKQSLMQRSSSSQYFTSSLNEFMDSGSGPVRRVLSTGDLDQGQHNRRRRSESESPMLMSNESNTNAIIEGMMTGACPYSPEEKREKIERYRSKRNLRNFHKKIKYACRKTLADSRPRIRGRFARNEEVEKNYPQVDQYWSHTTVGGEEDDDDEDEENWANFLDSLSANLTNP